MSKLQYVHVHPGNKTIENNQLKLIDKFVRNYLFSLISGLNQQQFGFNTLHKVTQEIIRYKKVLGKDRKFFIDSGGYSIIVGDVSPRDVTKFIECYNLFLQKDALDHCDYIFSLDIPIFLKYPESNTIENIYQSNSLSIKNSKLILQENKELYDKFIFIWQFKIKKQNEIWKKIYDENFRDDSNLRNFGIGGLVGLRGITNIQFSPFIAPLYRCLKIIHDKNINKESIIHVLGIYGLHDRVILSFIQKLFEYYLKDRNCKIQLTYDTINYGYSGLLRLRELTMIVPNKENNGYEYDYAHNMIDKMDRVIDDPEVLDMIQHDLKNIKDGKLVEETHVMNLLNVITQTTIDKIINDEIEKNNFLDVFLESKNFNKFKNRISLIFRSLENKYPIIFGNRTKKNLLNFQYVYAMHDCYLNNGTEEQIEKLIDRFISLINFPFDLTE